jgi:uncharacterized membrane protein
MDSASFFADGARQLNLGWTVTNKYNVYLVFLGIFLIFISFAVICFKTDYVNQIKSKKAILVLSFIGFALLFWGIYNTYNNFSSTVMKIKNDISKKGICSIFVEETAASTFQNIVNDYVLPYEINNSLQEKIQEKLELVRDNSNDFIFKKRLPNATDSEINTGAIEDLPMDDIIESALKQLQDNFGPPAPSLSGNPFLVAK